MGTTYQIELTDEGLVLPATWPIYDGTYDLYATDQLVFTSRTTLPCVLTVQVQLLEFEFPMPSTSSPDNVPLKVMLNDRTWVPPSEAPTFELALSGASIRPSIALLPKKASIRVIPLQGEDDSDGQAGGHHGATRGQPGTTKSSRA